MARDIEFLENENKNLRAQRDQYISKLVDEKEKSRLEICDLRKRIEHLQNNVTPLVDDKYGIASLHYDIEACLDVIGWRPDKDQPTYGSGGNSVAHRMEYVRDMLQANYRYLCRVRPSK